MGVKGKLTRDEIVSILIDRDGKQCQFPGCENQLDFTIIDDSHPKFVTIDHWIPKWRGEELGWSNERVWDTTNLRLMEKKCNAKKGERVPESDGTLPARPARTFKHRAEKRAGRPDLCSTCYSGRILLVGETCPDCGSGPQPKYPGAYQVKTSDCPHEGPWSCFACMVGIVERKPAYIDVFDIEETGLDG